MSPRIRDALLAGLAAIVCGLLFWKARALVYDPTFLPGWDGAGYILRGLKVHDALSTGNWDDLFKQLSRPDIRPPAFPLTLGIFMLGAGTDVSVGTLWAQLAFFGSLILLPVLGQQAGGARGRLCGIAAAVLTAAGLDHLAMVMVPMSESTTLLTTLGITALLALWAPKAGWKAQLGVGLALLFSALVRYNLPVMLVVPLVVWHIWESLRHHQRRLLDPTLLLWILPTVLSFGLWQYTQPTLTDQIQKFLVNRSSGLEVWSDENLLFFPYALGRSFLNPAAAMGLLLLFIAGLPALIAARPLGNEGQQLQSSPILRLLQWQSLAAIAALTLHDYKIDRNLYGSLPTLYLCALLPLTGLRPQRWPSLPGIGMALALLGIVGYQATESIPQLPEKYHLEGDLSVHKALDFIVNQAKGRPKLWITGSNDAISAPLVEIWLHKAGVEATLNTRSEPQTPRTRTGISTEWNDKYRDVVEKEMLIEKHLNRTTYITIETLPGSRRFNGGQRWTNYQNNYAKAMAEQTIAPLLSSLNLPESGMKLAAYAATKAGNNKKTMAEPTQAPLYQENFDTGGEGWQLLPAKEIPPEGIYRAEGMARFTIVLPAEHLQFCSPPQAVAQTQLIAVWDLSTTDIKGRAPVLQIRGVDAQGNLIKDAEGKANIQRIGPVALTGPQHLIGAASLMEGATHIKTCVILEGFSGEVSLDKFAVYPQ